MLRDTKTTTTSTLVIAPQTASGNTPLVGAIIDHQSVASARYVITSGSLADADATFTTLLEEGDASDLSDAAAVADADLIGTEAAASFTFAEDNTVKTLGYKGAKRYTRLTITPANNTGNAFFNVTCEQRPLRWHG